MTKPISNVQQEILRTFSYSLSEEELLSFKNMLVKYFAEKITADVDQLFDDNGWTDDKADEWAATHMRTPYKQED